MATFLFRCPKTSLPLNPGIDTDAETLKAAREHVLSVECPHCGQRHEFRVREGRLNESRWA
jgi:hypothetical protein